MAHFIVKLLLHKLTKKTTLPDSSTGYPYVWSGTTHVDNTVTPAAYIAFGQGWGMPDSTLVDVHGAGCQRSDPKYEAGGSTYPSYFGPQSDMRIVNNYVRCVRDI